MNHEKHEKTRKGFVPRLRFLEFRDAPPWEEKAIEALARVTQGGTPDTSNGEYWGGTINWMTPAEMGKDDSPYICSTMRTLTEKGLNNCSSELLPEHSVIVSTRAPIGHLSINTVPMAINQGCRGLVPVDDAHFLYYALLNAKPHLMDFGAGNTFKELSGSALKRFVLPTPKPAEQQKIADCLGSLDDLISAEGRKLAALRDHKKGLMQQLFPREGETRPRLRFPEFRDAGEWKEQKLSRHVDLISGIHLSPDRQGEEGDIPYFTGPSDFTNSLEDVRKRTQATGNTASADDVLITVKGSGVGELWHFQLPSVAIGRQLMSVRSTRGPSGFIFQLLLTKRQRFEELASGNLIPGLSRGNILDLRTPIPEVDEQQRIADCLSAVDALIAAQVEKLDALRTHKRGLMQQLFPSPEDHQ